MNMYKTGLALFVGGFLTFAGSGMVENYIVPKATTTVKMYKAAQQLDKAFDAATDKELTSLEVILREEGK